MGDLILFVMPNNKIGYREAEDGHWSILMFNREVQPISVLTAIFLKAEPPQRLYY